MASDTRIHPIYRAALPYAVAVCSVVLAVSVRLLADPLIGNDFPFATVFLAILLTAWFGGFRPALLAVICGGIGSALLLFPDRFSLNVEHKHEVGLALYALVGTGLAIVGGTMTSSSFDPTKTSSCDGPTARSAASNIWPDAVGERSIIPSAVCSV